MTTVATLGPRQSPAWQAACRYTDPDRIRLYPHIQGLLAAFLQEKTLLAILPVYNTREGENKHAFQLFDQIRAGHWIDNIVLETNLSLGVFQNRTTLDDLGVLVGKPASFRQCEEYINSRLPEIDLFSVHDLEKTMVELRGQAAASRYGFVDTEEMLLAQGLHILEREVAPHNRTRFAVLGPELAVPTGYDATALITEPLDDRVGLLVDILGEFSRRGINILDLRSENDTKTQKLQIYLEIEGHIQDEQVSQALAVLEKKVIQKHHALRILGSFPRVDMRIKHIKSFGFIGTGAMSQWFADRLENEGYRVLLTGRSSRMRPEEMIPQVDVVVICVPISATRETVRRYGPLLSAGTGLILLCGESEQALAQALESTVAGVEVMLVHNLWGPQAATMKDKNAIVVRTPRSGKLCSEFEAFLYKHGADIFHDAASKHDLLMGVGQKLPTMIAVALAMTLEAHQITSDDIASHCTLTSLYPILAMARVHSQNPRTYAEILSMAGASNQIVATFADNLARVMNLAKDRSIDKFCTLIDANASYLSEDFLKSRMEQARAVDEVLGRMV